MAVAIDTHIIIWYIAEPEVPEMPDRIIAATALHLNCPLVTRDHKIRAFKDIITIW
jgi:PIN domain nuclease of toxin-antitoxin system